MASLAAPNTYLGEKPQSKRSKSRSKSRSPAPSGRKHQKPQPQQQKVQGYASEGVRDHDVFNLPGSDWSLLAILTSIATAVRLFRIQQPTSVVFDEVQ
jgi:dolichyl-phosphate-mannose-protein mannosyltransferase